LQLGCVWQFAHDPGDWRASTPWSSRQFPDECEDGASYRAASPLASNAIR
jgi:hypothetical protein